MHSTLICSRVLRSLLFFLRGFRGHSSPLGSATSWLQLFLPRGSKPYQNSGRPHSLDEASIPFPAQPQCTETTGRSFDF
ncbi:hypothetical protein GALMADRAFT_791505 [Galerina marginata CBS 339.88]|uniref:Secreted protein n=1 Tax=Galerina marginata (strain CBS 339.88) TaxID=685588 RepID=A0A067SXT8_GALM3|nr:hypothetical protein GALMADRAFT_791505 [Galerina marginata CBS 339.88]